MRILSSFTPELYLNPPPLPYPLCLLVDRPSSLYIPDQIDNMASYSSTLPIRQSPAPSEMTLAQYVATSTTIYPTISGTFATSTGTLPDDENSGVTGSKRKRPDGQGQDGKSSAIKRRRKFPQPPGELNRRQLLEGHAHALEGEALLFVLVEFENKDVWVARKCHHSTISKAKERALVDRAVVRNQKLQITI